MAAIAPVPALAATSGYGLDTPPNVLDMPFSIEGNEILDLQPTALNFIAPNVSLNVSGVITVNNGWNPAQGLSINSNQIWKSTVTGDATLYLQYNTPNGNVEIGGDNGGNALLVDGYAALGTNVATSCNVQSSLMLAGSHIWDGCDGNLYMLPGGGGGSWVEIPASLNVTRWDGGTAQICLNGNCITNWSGIPPNKSASVNGCNAYTDGNGTVYMYVSGCYEAQSGSCWYPYGYWAATRLVALPNSANGNSVTTTYCMADAMGLSWGQNNGGNWGGSTYYYEATAASAGWH